MKNIYKTMLKCALVIALIGTGVSPVFSSTSGYQNLPGPPEGYKWQYSDLLSASFLVPKGWYFKEVEKDGAKAAFISRETTEKGGKYKTGFSINAIQKASEKMNMGLFDYANVFINNMKKVTEKAWDISMFVGDPPFRGYEGFFEAEGSGFSNINSYVLVLANEVTGTLYFIQYESPKGGWNKAWKVGKPILDYVVLDAKY